MADRRGRLGREAEDAAAAHLARAGLRVVERNVRFRHGEIDLVCRDRDILVFVEVKSLESSAPPEDAVGFRKRQRIIRAAQTYISRHGLREAPCRFDILAVTSVSPRQPEFRLLRDAFTMYN